MRKGIWKAAVILGGLYLSNNSRKPQIQNCFFDMFWLDGISNKKRFPQKISTEISSDISKQKFPLMIHKLQGIESREIFEDSVGELKPNSRIIFGFFAKNDIESEKRLVKMRNELSNVQNLHYFIIQDINLAGALNLTKQDIGQIFMIQKDKDSQLQFKSHQLSVKQIRQKKDVYRNLLKQVQYVRTEEDFNRVMDISFCNGGRNLLLYYSPVDNKRGNSVLSEIAQDFSFDISSMVIIATQSHSLIHKLGLKRPKNVPFISFHKKLQENSSDFKLLNQQLPVKEKVTSYQPLQYFDLQSYFINEKDLLEFKKQKIETFFADCLNERINPSYNQPKQSFYSENLVGLTPFTRLYDQNVQFILTFNESIQTKPGKEILGIYKQFNDKICEIKKMSIEKAKKEVQKWRLKRAENLKKVDIQYLAEKEFGLKIDVPEEQFILQTCWKQKCKKHDSLLTLHAENQDIFRYLMHKLDQIQHI